jgi:hypothetical protein
MGDGSEEEVIVVDRMMVTDVSQLGMVGTGKFEDDPISLVDSEAPCFVVLRVQLFRSKGRVIRVLFEKIRFEGSLALNGSRKFHEEPIECGGSR